MDLKWNGDVGPASIIGVVGSLGVLVSIGIAWGSLNGKVDSAATRAAESKIAVEEVAKGTFKRDERISLQAERLGKIETSITFMAPAIQRIEAKLDGLPAASPPH